MEPRTKNNDNNNKKSLTAYTKIDLTKPRIAMR